MPHKRAKASLRKATALAKGHDLPPIKLSTRPKEKISTIGDHGALDIPKNMYRILKSEQIRAEYKLKMKAKATEEGGDGQVPKKSTTKSRTTTELRLEPGEKLSAFNRRVEDTMRPQVTAVLKTARNKTATKTSKPSILETKITDVKVEAKPELTSITKSSRPTEFAPKPTKFSLHDIVMEPPLALTKPLKKNPTQLKSLPISNAQKRILEEEREKVIQRYRQMKEEKLQAKANAS
ncbi:hypothetical protein CROQUDRAFT_54472 [Cronartium quercuum f. sp. fusiforme G11]|uniref:Uncharacterized protein n=1 Tax=Cronartium quercuum f. sp. fusiforme G11 TaxID=708437 RepID=A0A9P6T6N2_9BASI|nr:hypothetical protein CROQUDRAFT_54472 [Cronartium quercuum f. sp. fusiforme G11]